VSEGAIEVAGLQQLGAAVEQEQRLVPGERALTGDEAQLV
jgi:hypothetical protein